MRPVDSGGCPQIDAGERGSPSSVTRIGTMDKLGAMDNLGAMDSLGAMDDPVAADTLGAILRRERDRRLWTQDRVAEACGVTRQQLSRYETGAATPSWETFRRVLAVFGVQPRISLERLDADVLAAIARQQRRPPSDWLSDVGSTSECCMSCSPVWSGRRRAH